jgi:beta-glucosidase
VAETLTGTNVPAGRLPMTYPRRVEDLPPFEDYAMRGRTYRFAQDAPAPLFPFGYGLSYTRFEYRAADIVRSDESILVSATVENVGEHVADEVTQVYVQLPHLEEADGPNPGPQLRACRRFTLQPGEVRTLELEIPAEQLQRHTPSGSRLLPGVYTFYIGGSQPDDRSAELLQSRPQTCTLKI